jgi:tripartite-type tricarboxylate transporter receptor subunit TctC
MARRRLIAGAAAALALGARKAWAQSRGGTLRLVVGFSPGGSSDRVARALAPELAVVAGRAVVVENVPGANSARAIARVAMGEPVGDTVLFASSAISHPDNVAAVEALRPVIVTSTTPMVLVVRASLPVHDPRGFARYLARREAVYYGSAGVGNATHLCAADLMARLDIDATHVPYQGSTPGIADLLGGRIDFMTMGANASIPQHTGLRMLAVTTAARSRLPGFDQLPTIAETIAPGFDHSLWQAVWAPVHLSDAAVATLNAQFREILEPSAMRAALAEIGAEVVSGSPDDAARLFRTEAARMRAKAAP